MPVPAGATGDVLRRALDEVAAPVMADFAPDWVLVSAGFDAHRADPIADLALSRARSRTWRGRSPASRRGPGASRCSSRAATTSRRCGTRSPRALGALVGVAATPEGAQPAAEPGNEHVERALDERRSALETLAAVDAKEEP